MLSLGNAGKEFLLDIFGQLETNGVVVVVELLANVTGIGPGAVRGRGGAEGGAAAVGLGMARSASRGGRGREQRGRLGAVVTGVVIVAVAVVVVVVGTRRKSAERNVGRETVAVVGRNFGRLWGCLAAAPSCK